MTVVERFWAKVDKDGPIPAHQPDLGPCWLWTAGYTRGGYGEFWNGITVVSAHRYSLQLAIGPLGTLHALHHCDNPPCVNPVHLYAGTNAHNVADAFRRGRNSPMAAPRTICKHGHELSGSNVLVYRDGIRRCVACRIEYREAHHVSGKASAEASPEPRRWLTGTSEARQ